MRKKYANNKGITLIALIITMLVLLILAGAAISMVVGNNGIINKANTAANEYRVATAEEEIALAWINCENDYNMGNIKDSTVKRADYYTAQNLNKYLSGNGTVSSVTYKEHGTSTVIYTSIENKNITNQKFKIDQYGKVKIQLSEEENISNLSSEELAVLEENGMTEVQEANYPANMQENENIKAVITGEGGNVPIPVNCTYLTGSNNEDSSNYGVVIKDSKNNEWVWIPVPDATVMYEENASGVSLSGETGVKTYKYSKSEILSGVTRSTPGTVYEDWSEPDLTYFDKYENADTYLTQAGFETKTAAYMAQTIVNEYENMIKSVTQYGGFYVGRYELSGTVTSPTVQKEKDSLTDVNWYELYNANKTLGKNLDGVTTGMIWGCQWDTMCYWLANNGDKKNIDSSSDWGNYKNATVTDNNNDTLKPANTEQKLKTGITDYTKANNMYDVAGNCLEWTMEANHNLFRTQRGGYFYGSGSSSPASSGDYYLDTDDAYDHLSSRPTLIVNPVP